MSHTARQRTPVSSVATNRAAAWSAAVCGVLLISISAAGPSWLDSAELIAAARELGGIHPPGHPAWLSLAAIADWWPLGPYGARVVWLSAVMGAVSAWFISRLATRALRDFASTTAGAWWSFASGLTIACSGSMWFIGARAEVYTLALATNLWALDAALRAGDRALDRTTIAPIVETAIAVSLGLLNHHYLTVFAMPAIVVAGWPALRGAVTARPRELAIAIAVALFLGLGYLAPSLRALADTEMRWGNPATAAGFWAGITAAHFQVSVTGSQVSIGTNLAVLLGAITVHMGTWLALLGLLGLGIGALRRTRLWWVLLLALLGSLATKALMAINTHNPDDFGYTALAAASLAISIAFVGGSLFAPDGPLKGFTAARRNRLSLLVVPWILLLAGLQALHTASDPDVNLANLRAPDVIDSHMRRQLSPGALYLSNYVFLGFNEQAWRIAEGRRPDLTSAHLSFRTGDTDGGRRYNRWLGDKRPALRPVTVAASRLKRAPIGNILMLAERWDVFAEHDPDLRIPPDLFGFNGIVNRLWRNAERTQGHAVAVEQDRHERTWNKLYRQLQQHNTLDHQTREVLLWQHTLHAAHALRAGWVKVAEAELKRAHKLAPHDQMTSNLSRRVSVLNDAITQRDKRRVRQTILHYRRMRFDELVSRGQ